MSAFAHKGGMHVHAVNRLTQSYEHIDPETVGNERRILVSELSGRSNIVAKTMKYRLSADDELMRKILDRVQTLENEGYQFEAAEASFDLLVMKVAGAYEPKFARDHYRVNVVTSEGARSGDRGDDQAHRRRTNGTCGRGRGWSGQCPRYGPSQSVGTRLSAAWPRCTWPTTRCG